MGTVLAVMTDLIFGIKIVEAGKKHGLKVVMVQDAERARLRLAEQPAGVILDLACASLRPLDFIAQAKSDPSTRAIPLVAFVPHVLTDLRAQASAAGCDLVVPRSVFAETLLEIFARFTAPPPPPAAN